VSSGGPDLFVICKHCKAEVSPYITECPYCGSRLRKRAPKLDRHGRPAAKERGQRRRLPAPSLGPLRRGEIPGIRVDARPYATLAIVLASALLLVLVRGGVVQLADVMVLGKPSSGDWWRVLSAPFVYDDNGYAFVALFAIAIFGWLLERRHGPFAVVLLFLAGGAGGMVAVAELARLPLALGANGAALALVLAWALPDVLDLRRGGDVDGDLLGAGVVAAVLLLLPIAVDTADPIAGATGVLAGLVIGYPLARAARSR
jgi:membrane associated rhomboid family serine protease